MAVNYFWKKNGTFITGQTNASLTFLSVVPTNAATYTCQVSNFLGNITSTGAVLSVAYPPTISVQPASQTIGVGSNFTVSVTASGNPSVSYQWRTNGTAIGGATAANYGVSGAQPNNSAGYDVVITNSVGSITSSVATVSVVYYPPSISQQPVGGNVPVGNNFTLNVSATGTAPLYWQWRTNSTPIPGANASSYAINSAQLTDAGSYDVIVTNSTGSVTSSVAVVNVGYAPTVTQQPLSLTNAVGSTAIFSCIVTGTAPITLQWLLNSNTITGETNSVLTVTNLQSGNGGYYALTANNLFGSAISSNAVLNLLYPPAVTTQPVGGNVAAGTSFNLLTAVSGTAPFAWQWCKDGSPVLGSTGTNYLVNSAQITDAGSYDVVITNSVGSVTSSVAVVNVGYAPTVTQQPVSLTNVLGGTASFSCIVTGTAPVSLQWTMYGSSITDATNFNLTITNLQPANIGYYALTATNLFGGTVSSNVALNLAGLYTLIQPTPLVINAPDFGLNTSRFSTRLAISGDLVAVGQALNGGSGGLAQGNSGLIHVFSIQSNSVTKLNTIMTPDTVYDGGNFGQSLGLAGGILYAGTPTTWRNGPHDGTAYLFTNITTAPSLVSEWTELPSQAAGYFGYRGCLVDDSLVVSQGSNPSYGSVAGAFFYRVDASASGNRTSIFSFLASDTDRDIRGLALSSNRCAVVWNSRADSNSCQVLVFDIYRDPTNGFNSVTTNAVIAATNFFGTALLSTACDGNLVAVGEPQYGDGTNQYGRVRIWRVAGGTGSLVATLYPPDLFSGGNFGECVFLKNNTLLVGSPTVPGISNAQGCVYIYNIPASGQPNSPQKLQPLAPVIGSGEYFGNPIVWDNSRVIIGSSGGFERTGTGAVYVYAASFITQQTMSSISITQSTLGAVSIGMTGISGANYVLQTATNLLPPIQWLPVLTNAADTNGVCQFTDTNLNSAQKFYRVTTP